MSNRTILFADDSATMRSAMEKTFAAEPFDVTVVPSGEAAIMKAREINPNVIIADAGMAGVSGYDVCKAIREDQTLSGTPFIVMAGVSNPYDETLGSEVGVSEYVKKPFDTLQLIAKVGELADAGGTQEDETEVGQPVVPTPDGPHTKRPSVAPAGPTPIATPIASKPTTKETIEFGRPSEPPPAVEEPLEFEPEQQPYSNPPPPEPEVQPIELKQETEPESFQVGTLAEMAQMDENGDQLTPEEPDEVIELGSPEAGAIPSSLPVPTPTPAAVIDTIKERSHIASSEIEEKVDGLSADQVAAITTLTNEVVERIAWEIVPDLAEAIIKEELARLLEE